MFAVVLSVEKIGPQKKIASFGRVVNSLRASIDGRHLFVGGMGYLAQLNIGDGTNQVVSQTDVSCRSIHVLSDRWLLLNQGRHGMTLFEATVDGLRGGVSFKPAEAIDRLICSPDAEHVLSIGQAPAGMALLTVRLE